MIQTKKQKANLECEGLRFDVAASILFPDFSRKKIKQIIDAGGAYLNKKRLKVAKIEVHQGDTIELVYEERLQNNSQQNTQNNTELKSHVNFQKPSQNLLAESLIVFENIDFLVLNKPAGIACQATLQTDKGTVAHALSEMRKLPEASFLLVHRLDKETSGLLIVAKNKAAQVHFENLFKERKVQKSYLAICSGIAKAQQFEVDAAIAKHPTRHNTYTSVRNQKNNGNANQKSAHTRFLALNTNKKLGASFLLCKPTTGRTHQIRVHALSVGLPLVGDKTYSQNNAGNPLRNVALRHMLHAYSLEFVGLDTKRYSMTAPLPADFSACLQSLNIHFALESLSNDTIFSSSC